MSASATIGSAVLTREDPEKGHRIRVFLAWMLALAFVLVIASYGMNYYTLSASERPFSPKHQILRPSGTIGVKLGMVGVLMFFLIYLYPLRKKWGWLGRMGNSRHWLDFHIVLGTAAPVIVAFHASFKFGNIAGMAFYSMLMVTLSGFVGRYLYSHIPRSLNAAELSMKEIQEKEEALRKELAEQKATFGFSVDALAELPSPAQLAKTPLIASLLSMFVLDIKRPFRTSLLRLQQAGFGPWVFSGFGLFSTRDQKLERAILLAQKQSSLSQSIAFLSRTQRIFQLWHVIHRPFSYAFAILAILHICLALSMGYRL
jgi:TRAP-type C4-dicarboxylate transport system permease small subunit